MADLLPPTARLAEARDLAELVFKVPCRLEVWPHSADQATLHVPLPALLSTETADAVLWATGLLFLATGVQCLSRPFGPGTRLDVFPQVFGSGRVAHGPVGTLFYDDGW